MLPTAMQLLLLLSPFYKWVNFMKQERYRVSSWSGFCHLSSQVSLPLGSLPWTQLFPVWAGFGASPTGFYALFFQCLIAVPAHSHLRPNLLQGRYPVLALGLTQDLAHFWALAKYFIHAVLPGQIFPLYNRVYLLCLLHRIFKKANESSQLSVSFRALHTHSYETDDGALCLCAMKTDAVKPLDTSTGVGTLDKQVLDKPNVSLSSDQPLFTHSSWWFLMIFVWFDLVLFLLYRKKGVYILICKHCRLILSWFHHWFCSLWQCFSVLAMWKSQDCSFALLF